MTDPRRPEPPSDHDEQDRFVEQVTRKAERRQRAQAEGPRVLLWMRAIGVVGWSVVVPTLIGVVAGRWLDAGIEGGSISWTLTLLLVGLVVGVAVAGAWIRREGLGP